MTPPPPERTRGDVPYVVPSWADPVVARATGVLGGPVGRYAVVGARGLVGAAVGLVLVLTGCDSDDDEPQETPVAEDVDGERIRHHLTAAAQAWATRPATP